MNARSPGFTLVELLVVTLLGALMMAAVYETLVVQQRGYREQVSIVNARQTTRTSLELLATELREISATGADLLVAEQESLTFRAFRKVGIVCNNVLGTQLDVWVLGERFVPGDTVVAFADDDPGLSDDNSWLFGTVGDTAPATCPSSWGSYTAQGLTDMPSLTVSVVGLGGAVRAFQPLTYGHYYLGDQWVLGRHARGESPVALLGPLAPPERGGLYFRYYDATGAVFTPAPADSAERTRVSRIEILVRGSSLGTGRAGEREHLDSLVAQVRLRGNAWY